MADTTPNLPLTDLRRVARLARLAPSDAALEAFRPQLAAILGHMRSLSELDLSSVEPMSHPSAEESRWDDDLPRDPLPTAAMMKLAPDAEPPFLKVPKVIGEGA